MNDEAHRSTEHMLFRWKGKSVQAIQNDRGRLTLRRSDIAIERLSRFRFFCGADYSQLHPDIGGMSPELHFIGHGADEHRQAAKSVHIARTLGEICEILSPQPIISPKFDVIPPLSIGIYVNSGGNIFMKEISESIANLLRLRGDDVNLYDENSDIENRPKYCIFVAPHEFFFIGSGTRWVRDDVLENACMYCTEQVQTSWFWESLHIVLMAKSVIDMSAPLAAAFAEVLPSACIFPSARKRARAVKSEIRKHPLLDGQRWWMDGLNEGETVGRSVDLCFLGTASPYRARFFARNAERISRYEGFMYLRARNAFEPMGRVGSEAELVDIAQFICKNSKIILNIHRDEFPYFEWHRLVYQGMANGCIAISEPCLENYHFIPGIHYLSEESSRIMDVVDWVLNDKDGMDVAAKIVTAATNIINNDSVELERAHSIARILTT